MGDLELDARGIYLGYGAKLIVRLRVQVGTEAFTEALEEYKNVLRMGDGQPGWTRQFRDVRSDPEPSLCSGVV